MTSQKLTLSVPEPIIRKAKIYAKRRNMSVSKLFAETIEQLSSLETEDTKLQSANPDLFAYLGVAENSIKSFDQRSAIILKKHG
jgi:hypothetical protein